MLLTIWSKSPSAKVLGYLSSVLRLAPELPVVVVNECEIPEGTTAVLALGTESLKKLQEQKVVAKNRSLTSNRMIPQMLGRHAGIGELRAVDWRD